jgi:hypothetical protein
VATQLDKATRARNRATAGKRILGELAIMERTLRGLAEGQELKPADFTRRIVTGDWVSFDASLNAALANVTSSRLDRVARAMADELVPFVRDAVDKWPVDTGLSKNGLNVTFPETNGALTVILKGDAPYTYVVKWGANDPNTPSGQEGKSAWATLFRRPAMNLSKRIAKRVVGENNGR